MNDHDETDDSPLARIAAERALLRAQVQEILAESQRGALPESRLQDGIAIYSDRLCDEFTAGMIELFGSRCTYAVLEASGEGVHGVHIVAMLADGCFDVQGWTNLGELAARYPDRSLMDFSLFPYSVQASSHLVERIPEEARDIARQFAALLPCEPFLTARESTR